LFLIASYFYVELKHFTLIFADSCVRKVDQTHTSLLLEFDHLNQTNCVQYNVQGWTKMVRVASKTLQFQALFHSSSKYVAFTVLLHMLSLMLFTLLHALCLPDQGPHYILHFFNLSFQAHIS